MVWNNALPKTEPRKDQRTHLFFFCGTPPPPLPDTRYRGLANLPPLPGARTHQIRQSGRKENILKDTFLWAMFVRLMSPPPPPNSPFKHRHGHGVLRRAGGWHPRDACLWPPHGWGARAVQGLDLRRQNR